MVSENKNPHQQTLLYKLNFDNSKKGQVDTIYIHADLGKVFDCHNHKILIHKLSKMRDIDHMLK